VPWGWHVEPLPPDRRVVLDMLAAASHRRFPVHGLVELDVSEARARLRAADRAVSWTGFVIATVAAAVARHPGVNARRAGSRVVLFDRVDVGATVERRRGDAVALDVVAIPAADRMDPAAITALLHEAKSSPTPVTAPSAAPRLVARLPGPARRRLTALAVRRPSVAARLGPAVGVTSLGMFGPGGGWAIPLPPLTVIVTVGGLVERAVVRDGAVVVRPMLPLTVSFDHGVVDGAPAARFVQTLRELTEGATVLGP
jgi:pyruvate/2-oxoglutarate dehydrogenase complex dihydrolipoamide acyltransferase (E2) component